MFEENHICMSFDSICKECVRAQTILLKLVQLLLGSCKDYGYETLRAMSAVPHGSFAVCKIRQREMQIAKIQNNEQEQEKLFYSKKYMELSPLKYNSKLMNSIWGLYNRYSVHNFKKITDAEEVSVTVGNSQISAVPTNTEKPNVSSKGTSSVLVSDFLAIGGILRSY